MITSDQPSTDPSLPARPSPPSTQSLATIRRVARERFGFERLSDAQEAAIQSVLAGRDTLAVMPTGSGKSAIYQIAGALMDGLTLIVSPLIALQQDQSEGIAELAIGEVAQLNSSLPADERRATMERLDAGDLEYLLLAPEQLANEELLGRLRQAGVALFVVDEAHCISEWGHDFRPSYLQLGAVAEALGGPVVLALTATAAPPVREEIVERLRMRDAATLVSGFDRPNIWLGVESFHDEQFRTQSLIERVTEDVSASRKPGIVYAATRKQTEAIAVALREADIRVEAYHAGLADADRERIQAAFMADRLDVIVATSAFGMGVDKPDVRFVYHHGVGDSVDTYYQEIGRAGRDGEPARAVLFYIPTDLNIYRFFAGVGQVDANAIAEVAQAVEAHLDDGDEAVSPQELSDETDLSVTKVRSALHGLQDVHEIETLPTGEITRDDEHAPDAPLTEVVAEAAEAQEQRQQYKESRLEMMRGYAELQDCRRRYLLNYFGEVYDHACGYCDNCERGLSEQPDEANYPFPLNSQVIHPTWGEGMVTRYEGDKIVVLFESVGYKTLGLNVVAERGLLAPAP